VPIKQEAHLIVNFHNKEQIDEHGENMAVSSVFDDYERPK